MLRIYNLDDPNETQPISSFAKGEHVIGRNTLNCKDARVSRNHALITVNDGSATLKSTHVNPTFYKPNGGNSIQLVKIETSITLKDGDQFALLPDDFWFKIRLENEDINSNRSLKRTYEDDSNIKDCSKQVKITDDTSVGQDKLDWDESFDFADLMEVPNDLNGTDKNLAQNDNTSHSPDNLDITVKELHNNSIENLDSSSTKEQTILLHPENIEENKAYAQNIPQTFDEPSTSDNNATKKRDLNAEDQIGVETTSHIKETDSKTSNDTKDDDININTQNIPQVDDKPDRSKNNADAKRVRCWYGETCYRRNPNHKRDFNHPGDSDYEEADEGIIAPCPFGDGCYRTNINHRKQYKHTKPPAPKPPANPVAPSNDSEDEDEDDGTVGNTKAGRKKRKAAVKKKNFADSSEDDYDLEDSFINDGSSDDFELSDDDDDNDSSDSDWQVSQAVSEESQETKRMIREARKFTKKKK